jgi:hypothetical protein
MTRQLLHFSLESGDYELYSGAQKFGHVSGSGFLRNFADNFNALLYHMVAVGVMNTSEEKLQRKCKGHHHKLQ